MRSADNCRCANCRFLIAVVPIVVLPIAAVPIAVVPIAAVPIVVVRCANPGIAVVPIAVVPIAVVQLPFICSFRTSMVVKGCCACSAILDAAVCKVPAKTTGSRKSRFFGALF